ncbi:MAG: molybdenum cofactor biosynthesis protein MoaE [Verrucomicrobia bacterium]|nr:MAG: molybdenum cofactor biosynthesis protein MoaE [Verrucomicrobiota bacterium]
MRRELTLTETPIDEATWVAGRPWDASNGAVVTFSGVVRDHEPDGGIRALEYTAFERMARHQFGLLFDEAERRWPIVSLRLVHRLGIVAAGETSLWIEIVAPHRGEALAACGWIVEEMKRVVPIWKRALRTGQSGPAH